MAEHILDPEVTAMRDAWAAISRRPLHEHDRILAWLIARLKHDREKQEHAAKAASEQANK